MIRRPPRSTLDRSSAASDVYKRQIYWWTSAPSLRQPTPLAWPFPGLSLIHISEPTRQAESSYAVFCLKKKNKSFVGRRRRQAAEIRERGVEVDQLGKAAG